MLTLALSLALTVAALQDSSPVATRIIQAPAASGVAPRAVVPLETPEAVRALCEALSPSDRLAGEGGPVERARAESAHDAARESALGKRYRVTIPAERLRFGGYDPEERELTLSDRALLAGGGGALRVWAMEDRGLAVRAERPLAERILESAKRRTLALALTFTLPEDEDAARCSHPAAGSFWSLGVEPVSWEYLSADGVLARGGEGGDRPLVTAAQGARPRVEVSHPVGDGGRELRQAVQARRGDLEGCYTRALRADPALDGALVMEVDLPGASGPARNVRLAADSVQDPALASCVQGVLQRVSFPAGQEARADIPIHFELLSPTAESGIGGGSR